MQLAPTDKVAPETVDTKRHSLKGLAVLIVEDSPLVRKMYGLALSPREHELTTAEDGRRALEILADPAHPFDLILLDLRMPDMDGVAFLRELRTHPRLRLLPVVLTTVEPLRQVVQTLSESGT